MLFEEDTTNIVYDDFIHGRHFINFNWDEITKYVLVIHALDLVHMRLSGFPSQPFYNHPVPTYHIAGEPDRIYSTDSQIRDALCACTLCGLLQYQEYLDQVEKGEIDGPIIDKMGSKIFETSI
tara:strand:+ start:1419 stop:1787 length:369 start_codon:yes stop_codon:yes gene_type:complete